MNAAGVPLASRTQPRTHTEALDAIGLNPTSVQCAAVIHCPQLERVNLGIHVPTDGATALTLVEDHVNPVLAEFSSSPFP